MKNKNTPKRGGTKTEGFFLRMTPEEKATLEGAAARERRTLSNYLLNSGLERGKNKGENI